MAEISSIKLPNNSSYNMRDDYSVWGGRNLLLQSNNLSPAASIHGWIANGTLTTLERIEENGVPVIHFAGSCTEKNIPSIATRSALLLEWGETYTVSCWLKFDKAITVPAGSVPLHYHQGSTESSDLFNVSILNKGGGVSNAMDAPAVNTAIPANTWTYYQRTFTTAASAPNTSYPYPRLRFFVYGGVRSTSENVTCNGWMKYWKAEKGNKPTDWSPAPEDIARFIGDETIELYSE